jgi:hypothetical protein
MHAAEGKKGGALNNPYFAAKYGKILQVAPAIIQRRGTLQNQAKAAYAPFWQDVALC